MIVTASIDLVDGTLVIKIPIRAVLRKHKVELADAVRLTPRERECLRGIIACKSNKEIAADLGVTERTVKFYVSSLMQKANNARTRMEAAQRLSRLVKEEPDDQRHKSGTADPGSFIRFGIAAAAVQETRT